MNEELIKQLQQLILSVDDPIEAKKIQDVLDEVVRNYHFSSSMKDRLLEQYSDENHPWSKTNLVEKTQLEFTRMLIEKGETDEQKLTDAQLWLGKTIGDIIRANNQQEKI